MRRACETAAEVLIRQKWSTLADVHVEHTPWGPGRLLGPQRGLAARAAGRRARPRPVWRDALGRKPQAQARPGAAGGPRARRSRRRRASCSSTWTSRSRRASPSSSRRRRATARSSTARRPRAPSASSSATATPFLPRMPRSRASPSSSPAAAARAPTVHCGRTRSTGALRVYTVVLTKRTRGKRAAEQDLGADLFVDGARELEARPSPVAGLRRPRRARRRPPRPLAFARRDPRLCALPGPRASAFARGLGACPRCEAGIELRGAEDESDGAAEEDMDDFDDDEDA